MFVIVLMLKSADATQGWTSNKNPPLVLHGCMSGNRLMP